MKNYKRMLIGTLLLTIFLVNMVAPASAYSYSGNKWNADYAQYCLDSTIPSSWSTPLAQAASVWNNAGADFYFYRISCNNKLSYEPMLGNVAGRTSHDFPVALL